MEDWKNRIIRTFDDPEDARWALKAMITNDCLSIGIWDNETIEQIINKRQGKYRIINDAEFDEVGNMTNPGKFYIILKNKLPA